MLPFVFLSSNQSKLYFVDDRDSQTTLRSIKPAIEGNRQPRESEQSVKQGTRKVKIKSSQTVAIYFHTKFVYQGGHAEKAANTRISRSLPSLRRALLLSTRENNKLHFQGVKKL